MGKKLKTTIKQANWKSKALFGKKNEYHNIVTAIYYQSDNAFIDTDSKLLFQMICEHFFHKHIKVKIKLTLTDSVGALFPQAYRLISKRRATDGIEYCSTKRKRRIFISVMMFTAYRKNKAAPKEWYKYSRLYET